MFKESGVESEERVVREGEREGVESARTRPVGVCVVFFPGADALSGSPPSI